MYKYLEKIKDKVWYMNGKFLSSPRTIPSSTKIINVSSDQIKFYSDTPNTIIYFNNGITEGFFRECRLHQEPHEYVNSLLNDYCKYVFKNEHSEECYDILLDKLSDEVNFEKFFNMGAGTASYSPINKFRKTFDSRIIGIHEPYPMWFKEQLVDLVQFVWGALDDYRYNGRLKNGVYHYYSSSRTMATKVIASIIDEGGAIVPETYYTYLQLDEKVRFGIVVSVAKGNVPTKCKNFSCEMISGRLQKELFVLNILDVLCYQKDHRPGNYFVEYDNGCYVGISAFDNDCPTSFLPIPSINMKPYFGSSVICKNGVINRPYIDKYCYEAILNMKKDELNDALKNSMSFLQFTAFWKRVKLLQRAMKKSVNNCTSVLLTDSDWSYDTINHELNGSYGETYLKILIQKYLDSSDI